MLPVWANGTTGGQHDGLSGTVGRAHFPCQTILSLPGGSLLMLPGEEVFYHTVRKEASLPGSEDCRAEFPSPLSRGGHGEIEEELGNRGYGGWRERDRGESPRGSPHHHSRFTFPHLLAQWDWEPKKGYRTVTVHCVVAPFTSHTLLSYCISPALGLF